MKDWHKEVKQIRRVLTNFERQKFGVEDGTFKIMMILEAAIKKSHLEFIKQVKKLL